MALKCLSFKLDCRAYLKLAERKGLLPDEIKVELKKMAQQLKAQGRQADVAEILSYVEKKVTLLLIGPLLIRT